MPISRVLSSLLVPWAMVLTLAGCAATGPVHIDTPDASGGKPRKEQNWSRVEKLQKASAVTVARDRGQRAVRTFVAADQSELITLNLSDATLPRPVTRTLRDLASDRPLDLLKASRGQSLSDGRVRLEPDGIFLDDRRVAALEQVVERAARGQVTEVRRTHRATRRGLAWGFLIGAGVGVGLTFAHCGTDWSQETRSCTNLTPLLAFAGPSYGALIGSGIGATAKTSTLVYRR